MMGSSIDQLLLELLRMTRSYEGMTDIELGLKLSEEVGEVAEALLVKNGKLGHKQIKEDVLHEVADVFNVCMGILAKHYNDEPEVILNNLNEAIRRKGDKYASIILPK